METLIWKDIKVKYNNEEFNKKEDVIDFLENIYKDYSDVFENVKTINLTNPDYMWIGRKRYEAYHSCSDDIWYLNYYTPNEF